MDDIKLSVIFTKYCCKVLLPSLVTAMTDIYS